MADFNRALYLDLLKRCLLNVIYDPNQTLTLADGRQISTLDAQLEGGASWLTPAHTMIGMKRLNNVQVCLEAALNEGVPGDVIETGVWRGGATILMRGVLKAYAVSDRVVWVADSFEGLPPPNPEKYPADRDMNLAGIPELAISLEEVRANFERYGLLDEQVRFLKGWFSDTLPDAPIERLALLRLDGDLYESTMDGLTSLYPKVSPGGFVIVDDYGIYPPCRAAVDDYLASQNHTVEIHPIDWTGVYWKKPAA
ncbi:MAG: TylF/MycF family methyltransferase [Chloroflexota bacterium]